MNILPHNIIRRYTDQGFFNRPTVPHFPLVLGLVAEFRRFPDLTEFETVGARHDVASCDRRRATTSQQMRTDAQTHPAAGVVAPK
jgi:hypothetical protein